MVCVHFRASQSQAAVCGIAGGVVGGRKPQGARPPSEPHALLQMRDALLQMPDALFRVIVMCL